MYQGVCPGLGRSGQHVDFDRNESKALATMEHLA